MNAVGVTVTLLQTFDSFPPLNQLIYLYIISFSLNGPAQNLFLFIPLKIQYLDEHLDAGMENVVMLQQS